MKSPSNTPKTDAAWKRACLMKQYGGLAVLARQFERELAEIEHELAAKQAIINLFIK